MNRGGCLTFLFVMLIATAAHATETEILFVRGGDAKPATFEVTGLAPQEIADYVKAAETGQTPCFAVYVVNDKGELQLPAMAGTYSASGKVLRFTPRFPLRPGMTYQAQFFPVPPGPEASPALITRKVSLPGPDLGPPTRVTAIYPTTERLPDNQLRFYIHFSGPMSRGEAYERIKLLDDRGRPIERTFLEIGEELWDKSCRRLTVLFDPGRVKRGLLPREEFGPVLEEGKKYTLVIDRAWHDEHGRPLAAGFEKRIVAGPPIENALDAAEWKIEPPPAGTRGPLTIRFPHPLDHALLQWTIDVEGADGKPVAGEVTVANEERRWEFRPEQPWAAGKYSFLIDTVLEDSAGNRIGRPFEVDVFDKVDEQSGPEFVRLPFAIE